MNQRERTTQWLRSQWTQSFSLSNPQPSVVGRSIHRIGMWGNGRGYGLLAVLALVLVGRALVPTSAPAAAVHPADPPPQAALAWDQQADAQQALLRYDPDEQTLVRLIGNYNAAEIRAAQSLDYADIESFLVPDGALARQRQHDLALREEQRMAHQVALATWGIGTITITGTSAVVTTNEEWTNREHASGSTETARMHTTYVLAYSTDRDRWEIVSQTQIRI